MTIESVEKVAESELEYHRVYRKNIYMDINSDGEKETIMTTKPMSELLLELNTLTNKYNDQEN